MSYHAGGVCFGIYFFIFTGQISGQSLDFEYRQVQKVHVGIW